MTAKTTTARKPVKLSLTSRAKSPRVPAKTKALSLRDQLAAMAETVVETLEPVTAGMGLDALEGHVVSIEAIETAPALTERECAAAGDDWISAKSGRLERYGVVEGSSGVIDNRCTLTTTNFHLLEVDAITGKVRYLGVSPLRPARSKKSKTERADACTAAVLQAEAENGLGLTNIRGIAGHAAATYAQMLIAGPVTPRAVEQATGLNGRQRCRVDHALGKAGWKLHHKRNPDRVAGDRDTANLYWLERAGA